MVKKVKKAKPIKPTREKKAGGFKFGRNLGSFLIVIGGLVLAFFLIFIPYSYISVYNKNKVNPFVEQSVYTDYEERKNNNKSDVVSYYDIERVKAKDFNKMDLKLHCQRINPETHEMRFELSVTWNDNTSKLSSSEALLELPNYKGKNVQLTLGVASEWVKFEGYSSSRSINLSNDKKTISSSFTVSNIPAYPQKANTWPVKINVTKPSAYLFLTFGYSNNNISTEKGGNVYRAYIVEFSFDDYYDDKTIGAFPSK